MAKDKKTDAKSDAEEEKVPPASEEKTEEKDESSSKTEDETEVDWQAIAQAEAERANSAEKTLADKAFKERNAKREGTESDVEVSDEDRPITIKDLKQFETKTLKQTQEQTALAVARANTSSESEAQAALIFWKTRVQPTGNLQDDVLFAIAGMNRTRGPAKAAEIKRAKESKEITRSDSASTERDGAAGVEPKLNANSPLRQYKYMGNNVYAKKLSSGKTLYVNTRPKPGQAAKRTE